MKSYIQGLITGGLFVFTFMVLAGHTDLHTRSYHMVQKALVDTLTILAQKKILKIL